LTPSLDEIRDRFSKSQLRWTRQREELYSALVCTSAHPTAEELYQLAKTNDAGLSLATVYNTLEALMACGLCRRIPAADGLGPCRYDAFTHPHAHVCCGDGRVLDVPADLSRRMLDAVGEDVLADLEQRLGVRVERVAIQIVAEDAARHENEKTDQPGARSPGSGGVI
jgi:Fur family transcriptional regulator, peroxide stress response regulator